MIFSNILIYRYLYLKKIILKLFFFERLILGLWQAYYFSENKLSSIIITTDYVFDNDNAINDDSENNVSD